MLNFLKKSGLVSLLLTSLVTVGDVTIHVPDFNFNLGLEIKNEVIVVSNNAVTTEVSTSKLDFNLFSDDRESDLLTQKEI